jgi:hypothetical protein
LRNFIKSFKNFEILKDFIFYDVVMTLSENFIVKFIFLKSKIKKQFLKFIQIVNFYLKNKNCSLSLSSINAKMQYDILGGIFKCLVVILKTMVCACPNLAYTKNLNMLF